MDNQRLTKTLEFSKLIHAFQRTLRSVRVPETDRLENDAEHSYLLATLAWYIIDTFQLSLDKQKVFEYALAHDMVEVYAGDTAAFGKGGGVVTDNRSTKKEREAKALSRIKESFPEFQAFTKAMETYDQQSDNESKFVYALDKLVPIIGGYAQDGRDWREHNISFDDVLNYKTDKIKADANIYSLFEELMSLLQKDKARYFRS